MYTEDPDLDEMCRNYRKPTLADDVIRAICQLFWLCVGVASVAFVLLFVIF